MHLHVTFYLFIISSWGLNSISSTNTSQIIFSSNETKRAYANNELNALLTWKSSLDKQSQDILASWHPNHPLCGGNWYGISCNNVGQVAGINLNSYGLRGTLHGLNLLSFTHLTNFSLDNNSLSGSIPETIGSHTSLIFLRLSINNLSGPIPFSIGNLSKLEALLLHRNQLSGSIPETIGNLRSVVYLTLSANKLSGTIPSSIGNLVKLDILSLYDNHIVGEIPRNFSNLINLKSLQVSNNSLSGSLPDNVCLGGKLVNFSAHHNQFTGKLPTSLKNCATLYRVRLEMNNLTGDLSEDLGVYPQLDFIDLSYNQFYGTLSPKWGQCKNLTSLSISNNKISGRLPDNLGEASQIQRLELGSNKLVGEIPKTFGNLTSLIALKLEGNMLSGVLPKEILMLSGLSSLNLAANILSGIIPEEIGECRQLLNLNLSCNTFGGSIPLQIGLIPSLQNLDLSHNKLSGQIPQELSQLHILESLNISHNEISGFLPSTLSDCVSLISVDISNNQLEGPLPNSSAFQNATFDSLKNNKGLCGHIDGLTPCSTETQRKKKPKVVLLIGVFVGIFVMIVVVGIYVRGREWKKTKTIVQLMNPVEDMLSIWSFDGKMIYENIIEATGDFNSKHCVGQGGYGSVYRAELSTGQVVAVKRLHDSESISRSQIQKSFISEIRALTELRHRNIVRLFGFCSDVRNTFLVYNFVDGDNLLNVLKNPEKVQNLKWINRLNIIKGVVDALFYMHHEVSPPLVHRDISSKNILLDGNFEVHITDFGTARILNHNSSHWTSFAGTFGYSAPELAYTQAISEKCDVYSFGVITLEVIMGIHPGELISLISLSSSSSTYSSTILLENVIDQRIPPPVMEERDKVILIVKLAFACLQQIPQFRPTMHDVSTQLAKSKPDSGWINFSSIKIGELIETGCSMFRTDLNS